MNYYKELNMKYRIMSIIGLTIILAIINFGCSKSGNSDNYYVKYEVNSSTIYTGGKLSVTISDRDSNATYIINTRTPWETTIGPVKKGFNATLSVAKTGSPDSQLKLYTQISASINNEPFVLKKIDGSDVPRNSVVINYTVGN